jgi:hypothetical protein
MRKLLIAVVGLFALLVGASNSSASPAITSVAQAQSAVHSAVAQGQGAIDALVAANRYIPSNSPISQALQADYNSTPSIQQAIIHYGHITMTDGSMPTDVAPPVGSPPQPDAQSRAAIYGDPCENTRTDYPGGNKSRATFSDAGVAYAWVQTDITDDWCFDYKATTGVYYWDFPHWTGDGVCITNESHANGPDGDWVNDGGAWHSTWAHGGHWMTAGFGPFKSLCTFTQSGHAVLRVADNGYWDWYDDFGY